jgi:hypothetical protein
LHGGILDYITIFNGYLNNVFYCHMPSYGGSSPQKYQFNRWVAVIASVVFLTLAVIALCLPGIFPSITFSLFFSASLALLFYQFFGTSGSAGKLSQGIRLTGAGGVFAALLLVTVKIVGTGGEAAFVEGTIQFVPAAQKLESSQPGVYLTRKPQKVSLQVPSLIPGEENKPRIEDYYHWGVLVKLPAEKLEILAGENQEGAAVFPVQVPDSVVRAIAGSGHRTFSLNFQFQPEYQLILGESALTAFEIPEVGFAFNLLDALATAAYGLPSHLVETEFLAAVTARQNPSAADIAALSNLLYHPYLATRQAAYESFKRLDPFGRIPDRWKTLNDAQRLAFIWNLANFNALDMQAQTMAALWELKTLAAAKAQQQALDQVMQLVEMPVDLESRVRRMDKNGFAWAAWPAKKSLEKLAAAGVTVTAVQYNLPQTFPQPIQVVTDPKISYAMQAQGWEPFNLHAILTVQCQGRELVKNADYWVEMK